MKKVFFTLMLMIIVISNALSQESFRRWRKANQIRLDKFDLILPEVMRENKIDMWIIMCREGNFDPMYRELGEGYVGHNGYYIFTDTGKPRIERSVLGIEGYLLEEGKAYDYFGAESELKEFVTKRDPKRIGLNMSKDIGGADGLSYTGRQELASILGPTYESRFVSAEKLVSDFRSRHVTSEITTFTEAGDYSYQLAERALSNEVITPGVTTLEDVAWWLKEQLFKHNLESSFGMPSIYVTGPNGIEATSNSRIIQRGDILMLDWGVGFMNMYTDMKRMAYVLKEGERDVPSGILHAYDQALKVRKVVAGTIKPGITAKQNEDNIYKALMDGGYARIEFNKPNNDDKTDVIVGCHSVGDWGHGSGPSIAFFNPVQMGYILRPTNLLSIEFFAYTPIPEWGGKKLRVPLEDDAIVTDRGIEWVYPINRKVLVIK
ncbi:MAG: aminopeptidase P family protein [Bacteroidetes bacterium]|nr:aminopeptidase P family protein [Bacteroidota bacterium]